MALHNLVSHHINAYREKRLRFQAVNKLHSTSFVSLIPPSLFHFNGFFEDWKLFSWLPLPLCLNKLISAVDLMGLWCLSDLSQSPRFQSVGQRDTNPFSTRWLEVSGAADNLTKHTFKLKEELDGWKVPIKVEKAWAIKVQLALLD